MELQFGKLISSSNHINGNTVFIKTDNYLLWTCMVKPHSQIPL